MRRAWSGGRSLEKIRAELLHRNAREAGNGGHVPGRNNVPLMGRIAAKAEDPPQRGGAAGCGYSGSAGLTSFGHGVGHAMTVEIFSTLCKAADREHLDRDGGQNPPFFRTMSDDHGKREVGDRLRQAREALGYSMAEFARLHGIDKTKLNHWEKGKHYPDPAFIRALYDRHRINADWIYLGILAGLRHDLAESLRAAGQGSSAALSAAENPEPRSPENAESQ